jgi:hypothetical protein
MEQDKHLKEILLHSAEGARADFTEAVMKRVHGSSLVSSYYEPLVSPRLKKGFVLAFGITVGGILSLCLMIALAHANLSSWIGNLELPGFNYNKLLLFLLIFWSLFALNMLFQKTFQLNKSHNF